MHRLPNRLHSSSPALNEDFVTRAHKPMKKKTEKIKQENEFLANYVASLYCKVIVLFGVALPISDAITLNRSIYSFKIFYIYLYAVSILFLCYMYLIQLRDKSLRLSFNEFQKSSVTPLVLESTAYGRIDQPVRYGSFYLRMGVTGFGMGSVIFAGFQFLQYFEYSSGNDCSHVLKATKPLLRMIFVLMQIFFILSTTNFIHVQKSKMMARFGLMHMIATNLCEWFVVVVKETQHDIYKSAQKILAYNGTPDFKDISMSNTSILMQTKRFYEEKEMCLSTNIIGPLLTKTEPYLAPCTIEYSVLCAVILGLMWKKNLTRSGDELDSRTSSESSDKTSICDVYSNRKSTFSVDCSKAHKGLFVGILVLILTVMTLILYSELDRHKEYRNYAFILISVWEFILFWAGILAAIMCIISLRDVGYYKMNRDLELEHLLLLLAQSGIFIYSLFQVMGSIHMAVRGGLLLPKALRIVTPFSDLIQSCAQTLLVLIAWRRRCITKAHIKRKPGKQLITFLLLSNFANWIICRFNHSRSTSHPLQMDFYGLLAWNIITHVSVPLVLTYRFQSTVCFYEIWTHVYKTTPIGTSCREFSADEDS